jgi:hypothetical protein
VAQNQMMANVPEILVAVEKYAAKRNIMNSTVNYPVHKIVDARISG